MKNNTMIDYELLIQNAMRRAISDVLSSVAEKGLPGDHYFYVDFLTHFPGVVIPESLKEAYPEDMMISIQYDFFDLVVDAEGFSVSLVFDEDEERITVPFAAITRFADPSVDFAIEFTPNLERFQDEIVDALLSELNEEAVQEKAPEQINNVVSFDGFRRK